MNRLATWTLRLYPATWRNRYGEEVATLMEDAGADLPTVLDLFKGAIVMQFSTWSLLKLATILGLAGIMAGAGAYLLTPNLYTASATMTLVGADNPRGSSQMLQQEVLSRHALSGMVRDTSLGLYDEELKSMPLDDVIDQMRRDIVIDAPLGTSNLTLRFTYRDKVKAEQTVRRMTSALAYGLQTTKAQPIQLRPHLEVLDVPSLPVRPLQPNPWLTTPLGLAAGLLIALLWRTVRRQRGPRRRATAVLAITGALAGGCLYWLVPAMYRIIPDGTKGLQYESHATMLASDSRVPPGTIIEQALSRQALAALIVDPKLQLYSARSLGADEIDGVTEKMRQDLAITQRKVQAGPELIDISFIYSDRYKAMQTVTSIIAYLQDRVAWLAATLPPSPPTVPRLGSFLNPAPPISVDAINPGPAKPILFGALAGLLLAALIAAVRHRWTPEETQSECVPTEKPRRHIFNRIRFQKLAFWLASTGAAAGLVYALRTPALYTSDALFRLENTTSDRAGNLVSTSISRGLRELADKHPQSQLHSDPGHGLSWSRVDSSATGTFRLRFSATTPEMARDVVEELVGAVDREVSSLSSSANTEFEDVRGVDGALIQIGGRMSTPFTSAAGISALQPLPQITPSVPGPAPMTGTSGTLFFQNATPAPQTETRIISKSAPSIAIPFDDDRAKPATHPENRAIRLNVIDHPALPSQSQGLGWWAAAIGAATGLLLAALGSLFGGMDGAAEDGRGTSLATPLT